MGFLLEYRPPKRSVNIEHERAWKECNENFNLTRGACCLPFPQPGFRR